jgi:CMP-N-acetylneuraminic acid synthetase
MEDERLLHGKRILGVIVARGGSKGLPGKNVRLLGGKPLIAWTVEAATGAKHLDLVITSTDSAEIRDVALEYGCRAPFLRPAELSTDEASVLDVLAHAVGFAADEPGGPFDVVVLLQATSPMRTAQHIDDALEAFFGEGYAPDDTLVSVRSIDRKYGWLMRETEGGMMEFVAQTAVDKPTRRQTLPRLFMPNGAIYITRCDAVDKGFYGSRTRSFVMSDACSIDVDTLDDFRAAEAALGL